MAQYYVCPECGFKQRSNAVKKVKCHRCGRTYNPRKAKKASKKPDTEKGDDFFRFKNRDQ